MRRTIVTVLAMSLLLGGGLIAARLASTDTSRAADATGTQPGAGRTSTEPEGAPDPRLAAADRAIREFLTGYLPLIYAQPGASVEKLPNASPALLAGLRADPGRVPPGQAALTPELQGVSTIGDGPDRALAVARVKDSAGFLFPLTFRLEDTLDGWLVTRIG